MLLQSLKKHWRAWKYNICMQKFFKTDSNVFYMHKKFLEWLDLNWGSTYNFNYQIYSPMIPYQKFDLFDLPMLSDGLVSFFKN